MVETEKEAIIRALGDIRIVKILSTSKCVYLLKPESLRVFRDRTKPVLYGDVFQLRDALGTWRQKNLRYYSGTVLSFITDERGERINVSMRLSSWGGWTFAPWLPLRRR